MSLYNLTKMFEAWNNSTLEWRIQINCNNENVSSISPKVKKASSKQKISNKVIVY